MILQFLVNGLVNGCLYGLLALGFGLIYNTTRIFHVAHGATFTLSAYAFLVGRVQLELPWALAGAIALTAAAGFGVLVERFVYGPLVRQGASLLIAMVSSLGLYVLVVSVLTLVFGGEAKFVRTGLDTNFRLGSLGLTGSQLRTLVAGVTVLPAVLAALHWTPWGGTIRAARDNPLLLSCLGIDIRVVRLWVFAAGSSLTGLAAALQSEDVGLDPHGGMPALFAATVAVVIGGVGSFEGAVLGGFLLGCVQGLVVWTIPSRWSDAVTFTILLGFLAFRPRGLFVRARRVEEGTA